MKKRRSLRAALLLASALPALLLAGCGNKNSAPQGAHYYTGPLKSKAAHVQPSHPRPQ